MKVHNISIKVEMIYEPNMLEYVAFVHDMTDKIYKFNEDRRIHTVLQTHEV